MHHWLLKVTNACLLLLGAVWNLNAPPKIKANINTEPVKTTKVQEQEGRTYSKRSVREDLKPFLKKDNYLWEITAEEWQGEHLTWRESAPYKLSRRLFYDFGIIPPFWVIPSNVEVYDMYCYTLRIENDHPIYYAEVVEPLRVTIIFESRTRYPVVKYGEFWITYAENQNLSQKGREDLLRHRLWQWYMTSGYEWFWIRDQHRITLKTDNLRVKYLYWSEDLTKVEYENTIIVKVAKGELSGFFSSYQEHKSLKLANLNKETITKTFYEEFLITPMEFNFEIKKIEYNRVYYQVTKNRIPNYLDRFLDSSYSGNIYYEII